MFRQYPLNGLNTFEDELLFFMAGVIDLIGSLDTSAYLGSAGGHNCLIRCVHQDDRPVMLNGIPRIFAKYDRSLRGLFEIRLTKQANGRWTIKIKEDMDRISKECLGEG